MRYIWIETGKLFNIILVMNQSSHSINNSMTSDYEKIWLDTDTHHEYFKRKGTLNGVEEELVAPDEL